LREGCQKIIYQVLDGSHLFCHHLQSKHSMPNLTPLLLWRTCSRVTHTPKSWGWWRLGGDWVETGCDDAALKVVKDVRQSRHAGTL
jgi:hypothetical protein